MSIPVRFFLSNINSNSSIYDHNCNRQRSTPTNPIVRHHSERRRPDDVHNYYSTLDYSGPRWGHHWRPRGRYVIYSQSPSFVRSDRPVVHSGRLRRNDITDMRIVMNEFVYSPTWICFFWVCCHLRWGGGLFYIHVIYNSKRIEAKFIETTTLFHKQSLTHINGTYLWI